MQLVCAIRKDTYLLYDIKIIKPSTISQMHQDSRFNVKKKCMPYFEINFDIERKRIIIFNYMNPNNPV